MAVIKGKVKWASVQAPNTKFTPQWTIDVVLEKDEAKKLKSAGFNVKKDKDGDIILKCKKNVMRKDGTQNSPPRIVDAGKNPFKELIGNGSVCNVQYNPVDWEYAGKKGVSANLVGVQVLEHVAFGGGDEFEVIEDNGDNQVVGDNDDHDFDDDDDFDDDIPF